jgi:hypothetical protein
MHKINCYLKIFLLFVILILIPVQGSAEEDPCKGYVKIRTGIIKKWYEGPRAWWYYYTWVKFDCCGKVIAVSGNPDDDENRPDYCCAIFYDGRGGEWSNSCKGNEDASSWYHGQVVLDSCWDKEFNWTRDGGLRIVNVETDQSSSTKSKSAKNSDRSSEASISGRSSGKDLYSSMEGKQGLTKKDRAIKAAIEASPKIQESIQKYVHGRKEGENKNAGIHGDEDLNTQFDDYQDETEWVIEGAQGEHSNESISDESSPLGEYSTFIIHDEIGWLDNSEKGFGTPLDINKSGDFGPGDAIIFENDDGSKEVYFDTEGANGSLMPDEIADHIQLISADGEIIDVRKVDEGFGYSLNSIKDTGTPEFVDRNEYLNSYVEYIRTKKQVDKHFIPQEEVTALLIDYMVIKPAEKLLIEAMIGRVISAPKIFSGLVSGKMIKANTIDDLSALYTSIKALKPAFYVSSQKFDKEKLIDYYSSPFRGRSYLVSGDLLTGPSEFWTESEIHSKAEERANQFTNYIEAISNHLKAEERFMGYYFED